MASRLLSLSRSTVKSRKSEHRALKARRGLAAPFARVPSFEHGSHGDPQGEPDPDARDDVVEGRPNADDDSNGLSFHGGIQGEVMSHLNTGLPVPTDFESARTFGLRRGDPQACAGFRRSLLPSMPARVA